MKLETAPFIIEYSSEYRRRVRNLITNMSVRQHKNLNIEIPPGTVPDIEGKTKRIYIFSLGPVDVPGSRLAVIRSKSAITAGDGARKHELPMKNFMANATTCNVFHLLNKEGVETHWFNELDPESFLALPCKMIPLEVVVRRIAWGSYLKRNPDVEKGKQFDNLVVEFFLKDDARHHPIMNMQPPNLSIFITFHPAQEPITQENALERRTFNEHGIANLGKGLSLSQTISEMNEIARQVFEILEGKFAKENITLVDLKIEFGIDPFGRLIVADVIDNDSWRIWPDGDPKKQLDKQAYREAPDPAAVLEKIAQAYQEVVEITARFLT